MFSSDLRRRSCVVMVPYSPLGGIPPGPKKIPVWHQQPRFNQNSRVFHRHPTLTVSLGACNCWIQNPVSAPAGRDPTAFKVRLSLIPVGSHPPRVDVTNMAAATLHAQQFQFLSRKAPSFPATLLWMYPATLRFLPLGQDLYGSLERCCSSAT